MALLKKQRYFILIVILITFPPLNFTVTYSNTNENDQLHKQAADQFPFVNQSMTYAIDLPVGIVQGSGTLTVKYLHMINESSIFGMFHVLAISQPAGLFYYNESAVGSENINNRHLYINAKDTIIIDRFMVHFFEWIPGEVTPTPMWLFPDELVLNKETRFWNYTASCVEVDAIYVLESYHEVYVFKSLGPYLNMTLMYIKAQNQNSDWYGLLYYMYGAYYDASFGDILYATFRLTETNAELFPLDELNVNTIIITTASFYSVVLIGTITYRLRSRKELIGGEV